MIVDDEAIGWLKGYRQALAECTRNPGAWASADRFNARVEELRGVSLALRVLGELDEDDDQEGD